jgi:hypothetical protein
MPQLPASAFSYTSILDKNSTPKKIVIHDTSDIASLITAGYSGFGIFLKVTFTSSTGTSTLYDNIGGSTPDILYPATDNSNVIALPLQSNGNLAFGIYSVTAEYQYLDNFGSDYSTDVNSAYEFGFTSPCVSISFRINLPASNITTIDTTDYGSYVLLNRQHTISPPPNAQLPPLSLPPITTTLSQNVYQNITTGTWGAKVISIITYQLAVTPDLLNWQLIDNLSDCIEIPVVSDIDINKLLCCLNKYKLRWERLKLVNQVEADNLFNEVIQPIVVNLTFYYAALTAGCYAVAAAAIAVIKEVSGCDCNCDANCPTVIPAVTPQNNFYDIDSPDNSITVTSSTVGNTTIFHLQIAQSIIDQINAKTYIVNGTSPITVATTVSPDGKTITYTVGVSRPIPYVQNLAVVRAKIAYSSGWSIGMDSIYVDPQLAVIAPFADHTIDFTVGSPADTDAVAFFYANFFTANQIFVPQAQVMNSYFLDNASSVLESIKTQNTIEANIMWTQNDGSQKGNSFLTRLYNPVNGEILRFSDLDRTLTYQITLTAQAQTT